MRITRLQLIGLILALIGVGFGGFRLWKSRPSSPAQPSKPAVAVAQTPAVQPPPALPSDQARSAQTIAIVGEEYRLLSKRVGSDITPIVVTLRKAKVAQTDGRYPDAMASAKEAWAAIKQYQKQLAAGSYTVARGDTLWRIAEKHSPVRQGPGWVTIWKANKKLVKDFDRIEVGWNLRIPPKRSDYVMPYWKPRTLARAKPATNPVVKEEPARYDDSRPIRLSSRPVNTPVSLDAMLFEPVLMKSPIMPVLPPVQYH